MGTQIGAVWNGKGFTFRDPRQLSLKQRLDVVKYVRSFKRNPRKFLKVDLVGLRRKMNPARVRKDTPRYFFQSGETVFPEYDKEGRLLESYGEAPAEVTAAAPPEPAPTAKVSSSKTSAPKSSVTEAGPSKSAAASAAVGDASPEVEEVEGPITIEDPQKLASVREIHEEYNRLSADIVDKLERLQRFADRESKLTGYEFGGEITDCPSILSYSEHAEIGGYDKTVLTFPEDV